MKEEEVTFFFLEFGDSSINFVLNLWVDSPDHGEYLLVGSEAIVNLKAAFDAKNIVIPFPIRTLDFGIKGDLALNEVPLKMAQ